MNVNNQNTKFSLTFDLINKSLNELEMAKNSFAHVNIGKIIDFSKKFESFYNLYFLKNSNRFLVFKRKVKYLKKWFINSKSINLKKFDKNQEEALIYLLVPNLKIFIANKNHKYIQQILFILIKLSADKIIPDEIYLLSIELILNILMNILNSNRECFYNINDELFNLVNDIIIALISYPKEIKTENINTYIITRIIDLFEKYLFSPNYQNIILTETSIWLKLLENHIFSPIFENQVSNNKNDIKLKEKLAVQKKLYSFLVKIYKFSLRNEYMENIIKSSILNLEYYKNYLILLSKLFWDEIGSIPFSEFKIKEGIYIPKYKYIFFQNIKPKTKASDISIIFSFKISKIEINKAIEIIELFDNNMKGMLKLYLDEKGFLSLENTEKDKIKTEIKISENICYFLCISIRKKVFNSKLKLFIDYYRKIKNKNDKMTHNYSKIINNFDLTKEFSLVLGKNNFNGVIGDFIIINKALKKKDNRNLFKLREDYGNILREVYNNVSILPSQGKPKYKIQFKKSKEFNSFIDFFKRLKFDIIFEFNIYDILYSKSGKLFKNIDDANLIENEHNNNIEIKSNSIIIDKNSSDKKISNIKDYSYLINPKNRDLIYNLYKMDYSYDIFYQNNGIDFLTFQLYNIFSKINENNSLNEYLYEVLSFIMELISYQDNIFISSNTEKSIKLEKKLTIFFLTLLILLINKKEKIYLSNSVILKLIEISEYFKTNKLIEHRNIILSILLDIDFYRNKEDIFKYEQIFLSLKNEFDEKSSNIKSLINKEFLYKILLLDFCFVTNKNMRKIIIELITCFIFFSYKREKNDNLELFKSIQNEFLTYFFSLKDEIKIYDYLKIIYFNFDKISKCFKDNSEFIANIIKNNELINNKHCKYCEYNQVLCFLISQCIINEGSEENKDKDIVFSSTPTGFMTSPSLSFIKCFFSQVFYLSNKARFKFIKTHKDPIDFIFSLIEEKQVFNMKGFLEKFGNIITYIKLLITETHENNTNLSEKIIFFFKFIINFLQRITQYELNSIKNCEITQSIKQKNEIKKGNNLQDLFSNENIENFFYRYLNINFDQAIEDLKYFIKISTNNVNFPFYFWFLSDHYDFNQDENNNYKSKLINLIIDELIKTKITFDINSEKNLVINNIIFLIFIYNFIMNNDEKLNPELEKIITMFLINLKGNSFFFSKYSFDTDIISNKNSPIKKHENKFILEMVCDIFFHFYKIKKEDIGYECLIKSIFLDLKKIDLFNIDSQYFKDEKDRDKDYNFYNNKYLKNIKFAEDEKEIIFSVYYISYLLGKYDKCLQIEEIKKNIIKQTDNFIMEIIKQLSNGSVELFKKYSKKIKYSSKKNKYRKYTSLLEYIKNEYKSKNFSFENIIEHYQKLQEKKDKKFKRNDLRKKTEIIPQTFNIGRNLKIKMSDTKLLTKFNPEEIKTGQILSLSKSRANSFCDNTLEITSFYQRFGFKEIDNKNELNQIKINNKNKGRKLDKLKSSLLNNSDNRKKIENLLRSEEINKKSNSEINYAKEKLKEINIPSIYYKKLFNFSESDILKRLFNPKEYYFWNKFNIILKQVIFSQKKFEYVHTLFDIKFRLFTIKKSSDLKNRNFSLKYPIKLKNFVCDDYYRPFAKPDINFFTNKLINVTHHYLKSKFLNEDKFEIDKINKIEFPRLIPNNYEVEATVKIKCEYINDTGSYFGDFYINHEFLLFISNSEEDPRIDGRKNKYKNIQEEFNYLYSYFLEERVKGKKKYIIMYYSEIKEIVIRRICFNYIGFEILMKNNKSTLFNFFDKDNLDNFIDKMFGKLKNKYPIPDNTISRQIIKVNLDENINFNIIKDLIYYFEKNDFRTKHFKGEISNFKYLLLLNKYSSRSYNDLSQYIIFPLLHLDTLRTKERDLSKVISLNKDKSKYEEIIDEIKNNYRDSGYYFNYHYSTSGYILYYLVRMNPFTYGHLKLQSNQFDVPRRMFYSIENYLKVISATEENRELIPEFFHNYEIFLNLNYLNLGYLDGDQMIINDVYTGDKNGIAEFITNIRQNLEQRNIIPWVEIIFGYNQGEDKDINNNQIYNIFPHSSYEENNNYEEIKNELDDDGKNAVDIINRIKDKLSLLSIGICPVKLFKTPFKKKITKSISYRAEKARIYHKKGTESNFIKDIENFVKSNVKEKSKIYLIDNNNATNLMIKTKKIINLYKLFNNENKNNKNERELCDKKQLNIFPQSKMFCEITPDIILTCRYLDRTIQLNYSNKNSLRIQYDNIITSVEFFSHKEKKNNDNNIELITKIIFGDKMGYLNLLEINYQINNKKQIELKKAKIMKSIKAHNSLIQGILYVNRLNIIISYSEQGQIMINNAFSFNVLNIIELGQDIYIKEIKISDYDLLYINCISKENNEINYIKCYSLNGIKFTELISKNKIINFFLYETLMVVYENNYIEVFNLYDIDGEPINKLEPNDKKDKKLNGELKESYNKKIIICALNYTDKKLVIIYDDFQVIVEDTLYLLMKGNI